MSELGTYDGQRNWWAQSLQLVAKTGKVTIRLSGWSVDDVAGDHCGPQSGAPQPVDPAFCLSMERWRELVGFAAETGVSARSAPAGGTLPGSEKERRVEVRRWRPSSSR